MKYRITDGEYIDEQIDAVSDAQASEMLRDIIYEHHGVSALTETYRADGEIYRLAGDGEWELVDSPEYVYEPTPPPCVGGRPHKWVDDEYSASEGTTVWRSAECSRCGAGRVRRIECDEVVSTEYLSADEE